MQLPKKGSLRVMSPLWRGFESNPPASCTHEGNYLLVNLCSNPKRNPAGRPKNGLQQLDAGNLTFTLKSGAKVNVSPKGQPHKIQVTWNIRGDKDEQFRELKNVLVPFEGKRLTIIPCFSISLNYTDDRDEFLDKLFNEGLI